MKKAYTKILTLSLIAMLGFTSAYAIQYTATATGNFNNASIWTPGVPPTNVGANDIIINPGVTVTLNQNVSFTFVNSILQLKGNAKIVSTTHYLSLNTGNLLGDPQCEIDVDSIRMGTLSSMSYQGKIKANKLTLDGAAITSNAEITVNEKLYFAGTASNLTFGSINFATGGQPPVMIFAGGDLIATPPGMVMFNNPYGVRYEASASISSTNWELTAPSLALIDIAVGNGNSASLQSDMTLVANLILTSGTLDLNGNNIVFDGTSEVSAAGTGAIATTNQSDISFNSAAPNLGSIRFDATNHTVNDFNMNAGIANATLNMESDLILNGQLDLKKGRLNVGVNSLDIAGGTLNGGSEDSYIITDDNGKMMMNIATNASATFHVGNKNGYAPVKITCKNGTSLSQLGVGVDDQVLAMHTSGTDWTQSKPLVSATWNITPQGAATVDADIELSWMNSMEANGFDNTKYFISNYDGSKWENSTSFSAATSAGNMRTGSKTDVKKGGAYGVFDNRTLGIDDIDGNTAVNIYPNPTNGVLFFNLKSNTPLQATIHDITGRTVRAFEINATDRAINVAKLKPGMYYLQLHGENVRANTKFIKQ